MDSEVDLSADDAAEAALLAQLRAGSDDAFEALVRTNSSRLLAVARRILTIEEDARDAVQDAFISAFRSLDRFEGQARLSTWLHRIVVNTALMKLRKRKRKPEEPLEPLLPAYKDDGHQAIEPVEWSEPVDVALERDEVRVYVRAQVDRLPENYRTVLLLRDIEELTTPEAAAALGISENAVKIRLHRARQALRTLIDQRFRPASNGAAGDAERTLP
jgi:RNA polymerase sigma-70 factor (ECF subfamily)